MAGYKPIILIAAMSRDRIIGNAQGNGMPWDVPEEFQHFLHLIHGQVVIMGRKSHEIFKGHMGGSRFVVLSRQALQLPPAIVCPDLESARIWAEKQDGSVFVAGGEEIYRLALPHASRIFLSTISGTYEGHAQFPILPELEWTMTKRVQHERFIFEVYDRTSGHAGRGSINQ